MLLGQTRTHTYEINDTLASVYWQDIIQKWNPTEFADTVDVPTSRTWVIKPGMVWAFIDTAGQSELIYNPVALFKDDSVVVDCDTLNYVKLEKGKISKKFFLAKTAPATYDVFDDSGKKPIKKKQHFGAPDLVLNDKSFRQDKSKIKKKPKKQKKAKKIQDGK